jgi:hypothetical protein
MAVRGVTWPFLIALALFTARPAAAQPSDESSRAEARKIGYSGVEAFQAGDFAAAHDRLETAYQLLQVPSLGLWSARALAKLGKLVEAEARYLQVIGLPTSVGDEAIQEQARQDARNERAALARRIPSVLVRVEGARAGDVAVTIDDAAVVGSALGDSQLVNPGRHRIEGVRGSARASVDVTVGEGDRKEALLRFEAAASATAATPPGVDVGLRADPGPPSTGGGTMRTVGWVTLGAGGAGLVVGAVTALVLRSKKSHLDSVGCGDGGRMCPESEAGNVDSYNSLRPIPGISLIAGAVFAGAGAYLLLTSPAAGEPGAAPSTSARRRPAFANLRLAIVPGGTMLSAEF